MRSLMRNPGGKHPTGSCHPARNLNFTHEHHHRLSTMAALVDPDARHCVPEQVVRSLRGSAVLNTPTLAPQDPYYEADFHKMTSTRAS